MQFTLLSTLTIALATLGEGHTIFQEFYVNGVSAGHEKGIRVPSFDGPITDVTSNDLICNGGPNPLNTPLPTDIIKVTAGSKVTTEWHHTLDGLAAGDVADPIDPSHKGPLMVYMAKVDSATTTTVTGLKWFKIFEDGLAADGKWATERLATNKGKADLEIPPCIADGDYLLRAEIIALHGATQANGAQIYLECAQLSVSGGQDVSPPGSAIPGIYKATDPGIMFNLYNNPKTYPFPGPAVFTCDGTAGAAGNATAAASTSKSASKQSQAKKQSQKLQQRSMQW